jgi:hypothetical protein
MIRRVNGFKTLPDGTTQQWCPYCDLSKAERIRSRMHYCTSDRTPPTETCGPGCQLRRTLAWWGIRDDGSCGCDSFAAKMDAWGPDCWDHIEEIVEHLREAAGKKGLPFIATAARIMVGRAIEAARAEAAATPPPG